MTRLPYDLAPPIGHRANLGLVVLQTDETIEQEFRHLIPTDGVALYTTRIPSGADVTPETLAAMQSALPVAAGLLPPSVNFDVIGYACTSGATIIGPNNVAAGIRQAATTRAVTDPLTATKTALDALDATRIGFVTPYSRPVSAAMREALEEHGIEIAAFASFEEESDARVARIDPKAIVDAAIHVAAQTPCDAIFLACTNLRALSVINAAEKSLGVPVFSSNLALAWHMLRLAELPTHNQSWGRLMQATA